MDDFAASLLPVLFIVPVIDWVATIILLVLAIQPPHIAFLIERAIAAVILSLATTAYALVALNTEAGFPVIDSDTARALVRVIFIILGAFPVVWIYLYFKRRR